MKRCCYRCFTHPWLKKLIHDDADKLGTCAFCGSKSTALADVSVLYESFQNLLSMYNPVQYGVTVHPWEDAFETGNVLTDLIQNDWEIFSDALLESDRAAELLVAIQLSLWEKDSGEDLIDTGTLYTRRRSIYHTTPAQAWTWYCEGIKEEPDSVPEIYEFLDEELYRVEEILPQGRTYYRARPGYECEKEGVKLPHRGRDIGAPPPKKAKAGRANAEGNVVLYCADHELTAVRETKESSGSYVSVCELRLLHDLRIADLSKPIAVPNPFTAEILSYEVEIVNLLNAYAEEMSRPLESEDDKTEYIPCQILTAYIRDEARFDGVRYPSAMHPEGTNIVIFNPVSLEVLDSKLVRLTDDGLTYE